MKTLKLLIIFTFLAVCSFGQIKESVAIDSIFTEWTNPNSPGCALGIIKDGELIYSRGYGMANLEYNIPNSPLSVFRIGSTSKQFTAACIILLAEGGKLNLDNSLNQFFPDFPPYAKKITIRHLLNHTSGIRDYLAISYLKGFQDDDYYTDKDVMKWLVNQKDLNFSPGDEFLYSNSGYWLLGQIVNKVAGENMADFAQREIFEPLGMTNTHFHNDHTRLVKNRASGYVPNKNNGYKISMTTLDMIGDGGIFTTIEDVKKWDDAFYNREILSDNFWTMMTKQGVLNNGEVLDYASGLIISSYKGLKTISHGGAFVGFRADLIRFPDQHFSVAIFTNRGDANPTELGYRAADIFLINDYESDNTQGENSADNPQNVIMKLSSQELKMFAGYYWNSQNSYSRKIYVKNDTLRYSRSETNESALLPVGTNEFKMVSPQTDILVQFKITGNDIQTMSVIINSGEPTTFVSYEPVIYSKEELNSFSGVFYSDELDVNYSLKMKGDSLFLYMKDNEISPLTPIMTDLFTNERYGTFRFQRDTSGDIKNFRLAAGRVKNLNFVKL